MEPWKVVTHRSSKQRQAFRAFRALKRRQFMFMGRYFIFSSPLLREVSVVITSVQECVIAVKYARLPPINMRDKRAYRLVATLISSLCILLQLSQRCGFRCCRRSVICLPLATRDPPLPGPHSDAVLLPHFVACGCCSIYSFFARRLQKSVRALRDLKR